MKVIAALGGVTALGLGWVGLQAKPAPFAAVAAPDEQPRTVPLPDALPAPVERFYRQTYGEQIPVIHSAVLSGRGSMRLFGLTIPIRFRFNHVADRAFSAYFELTYFGHPLMKISESYVEGRFRSEGTPAGVEEGQPKLDHSAGLRMWAEWLTWLPAMLLTDPEVRWEAISDSMALLVVPVGGEEEELLVRFDPASGTVQYWEALKYKQVQDASKSLWINGVWFGDRPWSQFEVEEIVTNVDVDLSPAHKGP